MPSRFTYGSLCSGIGSEAVAWDHLGWTASWFSEVDPFCCEFLQQKYPDVHNLGDMTEIKDAPKVDLIIGGTPCQSFSINTKGKGMADPRGQLSLHFTRIVEDVRPRWVIWENVPNALRVDGGRAFGSIVRALGSYGYGWAYRVFDLRGFGVPQRRRRLFLVGCLGGTYKAVAVTLDGLPDNADDQATVQARKEASDTMAGWAGDETPKLARGCCPTLRSGQGGEGVGCANGSGYKLTITEWERLQGFPDGYTTVDYKGKPASDAMRRRVIGNSFPPPIVRWIGERIDYLEP